MREVIPPNHFNIDEYNRTCYIVGGGPSLKIFDWADLQGKFVFAINRAYEVLPDAQILYFTDDDWWMEHQKKVLEHKGLKVKASVQRGKVKHPDVVEYLVNSGHTGIERTPGHLRHGYNSTYAAINLAYQLGFKTIYMMGVDMRWAKHNDPSTSHWHSGHSRVQPEERTYKLMRRSFETINEPLKAEGVQLFNVNPIKTIHNIDHTTYTQLFGDKYAFKEQDYLRMIDKNDNLIGDKLEQVLEKAGVKKVVKVVERITKKPCNCEKRKQALNNFHKRILKRGNIPPRIEPVTKRK